MDKIIIEDGYDQHQITVHTSFNIQENPAFKLILERIIGVERCDFNFYKYKFHVHYGKAFDKDVIKNEVRKKIYEFLND